MTRSPLKRSLLSLVMASISKPSPENQIQDFIEISQTSQTSHDPGRKKGSHEGRLRTLPHQLCSITSHLHCYS